ncbi:unnamed protein product [Protopolystoma xenopodis]|uniref:Uncharacterized protein n=1 Tax=Protopolystoma xenopodis TaxID=117903 RepID=A0A448WRP7_9PLAT|nr:unnamed protein product [Protopolystoma xenopodis]
MGPASIPSSRLISKQASDDFIPVARSAASSEIVASQPVHTADPSDHLVSPPPLHRLQNATSSESETSTAIDRIASSSCSDAGLVLSLDFSSTQTSTDSGLCSSGNSATEPQRLDDTLLQQSSRDQQHQLHQMSLTTFPDENVDTLSQPVDLDATSGHASMIGSLLDSQPSSSPIPSLAEPTHLPSASLSSTSSSSSSSAFSSAAHALHSLDNEDGKQPVTTFNLPAQLCLPSLDACSVSRCPDAYPHHSLFLCAYCRQPQSLSIYARRSLFVESLEAIGDASV